jgi:SARP family transcriptional regulator, regulator of embCAB operon
MTQLITSRPPIRLVTMGAFAVERAGRPIPAADFQRRKGRALLAALLCAGEPVHRDQLLEWFWPALAPERGLACLFTTLYALRRALEPTLSRGVASSLVVCDGESYRLDLGEDDSWDGEEILRAAGIAAVAGADALTGEELARAEALCAGSFLPEWPYEDWSQRRRAEIEEARVILLEASAEARLAAGQPRAAIARYRQLLALEPESECWHRALMRAYTAAGEVGLALRQYDACRRLMRRSQGSEPSAETVDLFMALLRRDGERQPALTAA